MINIILCDDNEYFRNKIINKVKDLMGEEKQKINIFEFYDYNSEFELFIRNEATKLKNKIYLLDIETPSGNGINMARIIRKNDLSSFLIYITSYSDKYSNPVLRSNSRFSSYISKDENYILQMDNILRDILNQGFDDKIIEFIDQGIKYTMDINDIVYIKTIPERRKTMIITDYAKYIVNKNLKFFEGILDSRFQKSHKCCLVNTKHVEYIDFVTKVIKFDNGQISDLISSTYIKSLKQQKN